MSETNTYNVNSLDRAIHAPARLIIMIILDAADSVDFVYLLKETQLTNGNLASHLKKLEEANYITVEKTFQGRTPLTTYKLTREGREAFHNYRKQMQQIINSTST